MAKQAVQVFQEHEHPLVVMGRLREAIHFTGYGFDRIFREYKDLLRDDRWLQCGYDDFKDFVVSLSFGWLQMTVEQRKEIEALTKAAGEVSNRRLAKMLGVHHSTVDADLAVGGNPPAADEKGKEIEGEIVEAGGNPPPPAEEAAPPPKAPKPQAFTLPHEAVSQLVEGKNVRGTQGTGENEWFTPAEHLDRARRVLGAIDLDPASNPQANDKVGAAEYFTKESNGLDVDWHGRIWLNPPYAQPAIQQFADKMVAEWSAGRVTAAVMLTHNYTDTTWFQTLAHAAQALCFTRGRIKFEAPDGSVAAPTQGQAFFYFGQDVALFVEAFAEVGFVVEVRQ